MRRLVAVVLVASMGCTAAFRTTSGGATAKAGVAGGTTNSIYLGDRGGILTRLGVAGLGVVAVAGSVQDVQTERDVNTVDDKTIVTDVTTGTVDPKAAAAAAAALNAAADPNANFGDLSAGLEIAGTWLGGDTSGWMFDFGYAGARTRGAWGLKGYGKLGFGRFTFHDRARRAFDSAAGGVTMTQGDSTYPFFGVLARIGLTYAPASSVVSGELFVQPDLNTLAVVQDVEFDADPAASVWHTGLRLVAGKLVFIESKLSFSAMRAANTSLGVEAGIAF